MKYKIKVLIVLFLLLFVVSSTYCVFVLNVVKTGNIEVNELSTVLLSDDLFLAKLQDLDPSITEVDKENDLTRSLDVPSVTFTDDNVFSMEEASVPAYLWIDDNTIYYYTIAEVIDLNITEDENNNGI